MAISATLTSFIRAIAVARIDDLRRRIALMAMVAVLVNALCPFLEAFAAPDSGQANFIEICSSTGIKLIPATDKVRSDGAGSKGDSQDQARGKRECALCPVSADAQFILPPTATVDTAAPASLPTASAAHAASVPYEYRQSLHARGPPAHSQISTPPDAMSGAESNHMVAAHPARDHALTAFHATPASGATAAPPRFEKSLMREAASLPIASAPLQTSRPPLSLPSINEPHGLTRATTSDSS